MLTGEQADVIRNGKGNVYMGLSKHDSDTLWRAVQTRKYIFRFRPFRFPLLHLIKMQKC